MSLTSDDYALLRVVTYSIIRDPDPASAVERVAGSLMQGPVDTSPEEYLDAINKAKVSDDLLDAELGTGHDQETLRDFLDRVAIALEQRLSQRYAAAGLRP